MSHRTVLLASAMLVLGFAIGAVFAKKNPTSPEVFLGKSPKDAANGLLARAREHAGDGSWENIAIGRMYYLTGDKAEGQKVMDAAIAKKSEAGDWIRIGRVYYAAGEWDKAKSVFDKVLQLKPDDADWLAEIGAYELVKGNRSGAEELFRRSLALDPESMRNELRMAGAYRGLAPAE